MHACVRVHACWPLLAPDAHTLAPQRTAYSLHGVHARQVSCGVLPRTCIIALTSSPNRHPAACAWLASISHRVARGFLDGAHDCAMPSALPLPLRGWWWRMRQASQAAGERSHFRTPSRPSKTKKNCNRPGARPHGPRGRRLKISIYHGCFQTNGGAQSSEGLCPGCASQSRRRKGGVVAPSRSQSLCGRVTRRLSTLFQVTGTYARTRAG